ncbi:MAG: c-type cytochrome [Paracoccaceae bacterium]
MTPRMMLTVLALTLPAWSQMAVAETPAFQRIKLDAGARLFDADCRRCHSTDTTHESYGPVLEGIIGRRSGSVEGYAYSEALMNSGITWTEQALIAWMADNQGLMPGTKMRHVGITDPVEAEFILTYLRSVQPN